jgi:protein phosphatase
LLSGSQLTIAHVGDSRLYLFRDGTLTQMTQDDSWAASAAADNPQSRHILTGALGAQPRTDVHIGERELAGGELLLLCTDGLHGTVAHEKLLTLLQKDSDLETLGRSLVEAAIELGTRDNITALLVRYTRDE